jgi:hypothetical protein
MKKTKHTKIEPWVYEGRHNADLAASCARLDKGQTYKDLSTICLIPTRGVIPAKVCLSLWNLMSPMNQKFFRHIIEGKEVGDAYNEAVGMILDNPELSKWKYILTAEEDNLPPPDGLLKLYESMDKYDAVGGLYWTKGEGGQPMIYGNPAEMPKNFIPQRPIPDSVQECNGLGMGFTLFKLSMFKKVPKPWFKTLQEHKHGEGGRAATQDLFFFQKAALEGFRFASDNRVKVGHLDPTTGEIW